MRNDIPRPVHAIITLFQLIIAGLLSLEVILKIKTHTQVVMQAVLDALIGADTAYRVARDATNSAQDELDRQVEAATAFAEKMIDACKLIFGRKWNSSWQQVGMVGPGLALPKSHTLRLNVLRMTAQYLEGHPAAEIPAQGFTKVAALALAEAYRDAMANLQACRSDAGEKRAALDTASENAANQMRGFIRELWSLLPDTDARWRAFGLNPPGWPEVPGRVENLIVTPGLAGSLYLEWDIAPRAARYKVEMQLMAPEAEWTLMTTVAETSVMLTELTPGANVLLRVTAANDGGEGVPSKAVQAQVPVALAA